MPITFDDFQPNNALESSSDAITLSLAESASAKRLNILDIGCGNGGLANQFAKLGHNAFGVEPQASRTLKTTADGAQIHKGVGESLPFDDESFDIVIFGHSLHHVAADVLPTALSEALRVLKPLGKLVVAEPLAVGPFYHVMQPVDDEAPLYELVKEALQELVLTNQAVHKARTYVYGKPTYKTVEHLKRVVVKVDPDRAKAPNTAWLEFNKRFMAQPKSWFFGKRSLKHFSRVDVFQKSA